MVLFLLISFSFLSLLFFLGELVIRAKDEKIFLLSYIYLTAFCFFIHSYLMHSNAIYDFKYLFLIPTPFLAFLGPIVERYLFITFEAMYEPFQKFRFKFIPALLVIVLVFPYYFRDTTLDLSLKDVGQIHIAEIPFHVRCGVVISITSLFYFCLTPLISVLKNLTLNVILSDPKLRLFFIIASFWSLLLPVMLFLTLLFDRFFAHISVSIYSGFMLSFFFLLKQRNPDFFQGIQQKVLLEKKYRKSQLTNLNLELIRGKFLHLFETEKVFLDENLSLSRLAQLLDISNHQLSEYLNTIEQKQFYQIVAMYRVLEAKRQMTNNTKANLLEIAYASGFNSKSSFNQVFKQSTGLTPTEFKKKLSKTNGLDD
ncbi:AraC family transcriptional regulator [Leptospira ognonensis]|uniref:AraC family transcriptional regulator n=1 Tax=Leptospira ognonensis TaxID=2484945 RepID=A0A4R9JY97_9LEPT|nr:helix-turn-helix domain-containing protein [Leptospira ognonensis]TGL58200.1 AraC family transcriptional regulator [Leptospira ognonensis]